jgi:hypothetical protein
MLLVHKKSCNEKIGLVKNLKNTFDFFVLKKPKLSFVEV